VGHYTKSMKISRGSLLLLGRMAKMLRGFIYGVEKRWVV